MREKNPYIIYNVKGFMCFKSLWHHTKDCLITILSFPLYLTPLLIKSMSTKSLVLLPCQRSGPEGTYNLVANLSVVI